MVKKEIKKNPEKMFRGLSEVTSTGDIRNSVQCQTMIEYSEISYFRCLLDGNLNCDLKSQIELRLMRDKNK